MPPLNLTQDEWDRLAWWVNALCTFDDSRAELESIQRKLDPGIVDLHGAPLPRVSVPVPEGGGPEGVRGATAPGGHEEPGGQEG